MIHDRFETKAWVMQANRSPSSKGEYLSVTFLGSVIKDLTTEEAEVE